MSLTHCCTCGREYTNKDGDYCHADGGVMEIIHGGGQCRDCYIKSGHPLCSNGHLNYSTSKFCHECGVVMLGEENRLPITK